ncbi:MAG TPA: glycine zipper family protein [Candidatus Nitrosotalea sp.]|nr:glycine zipper family protein [Candidatus Nitrosotalea sp.]
MTETRSVVVKGWMVVGALLLATGSAWGQQIFIYPQKGQTPQQQAQDTAECQAWATQQTGGAQAPAMAPAPAPTASPLKGAARGAAVGAVGGAIAGDAGKGAAIGAAGGAMIGGMRRRDQEQQAQAQQAQAQQMQAAQGENYKRALSSCLGAKGYSVN